MSRDRLVTYALDHNRVETYFCMRHRHDHGEFQCESRVLADHNLIYMLRGRAVWRIEGEDHGLNAGDLLVVPMGRRHEAWPLTKRVLILSLHVIPRLPGRRDAFELLQPSLVRGVPSASRLHGYLHSTAEEFDRPDVGDTVRTMPGWCRLIVGELIRSDADGGRLSPQPVDPLVAALLDGLHDRLATPTTLADLAQWSGYSAQHLNRVFGEVLGTTPLKYLARLRIDKARDLLLERDRTVAAVAESVGIDDPYYFSRLFKQHTGLSPSEYRAQVGSESPS